MRIGIGYDIHPLVEKRPLFLGGIEIPFGKGLAGHSDGDALIHAICDAILGALCEGDIGQLFPDTDPQIKGMRSDRILERTGDVVRQRGFHIVNIDTVVAAEEPKIVEYRAAMKARLATVLDMDPGDIGIKGKRGEGFGAVGRREAIEVYAVALLRKVGDKL